ISRESASQPDGAIAAERADLQDALRVHQPRQHPEQLAVTWRDADRRQPGLVARLERGLEYRVGMHQRLVEVAVDFVPDLHQARSTLSPSRTVPSLSTRAYSRLQPGCAFCETRPLRRSRNEPAMMLHGAA